MKLIWTVIFILLLAGCTKEDPRISLTQKFWQAIETNDIETLKQVLSDPRQAEFLASGNVGLAVDSYEVLGATEIGVNVKFVRHCYPDAVVPTVIVEVEGEPRVDLMASFQAQMKKIADSKPTKQYCYDFAEKPLQGMINGKPWKAHHMNRQMFDFGTRKKEQLSVVAEECPQESCFMLSSPSIVVSNLDLRGEGGNFDSKDNVTIFTPPSDNKIITQGSYRIATTSEGKTKLEISFSQDDDNALNGYIIY